ncbi:MAG: hypothetical protein FJW20_09020 [Acidimicrobiia bacterium]|nr:hypothetical protein [Acidimicrobiia bacterium]
MRCLHCGKRLPILKQISSGEFCSENHRAAYIREQEELALLRLVDNAPKGPLPSRSSTRKSSGKANKRQETREFFDGLMDHPALAVNWGLDVNSAIESEPVLEMVGASLPRLEHGWLPCTIAEPAAVVETVIGPHGLRPLARLTVAEGLEPDLIGESLAKLRGGLRIEQSPVYSTDGPPVARPLILSRNWMGPKDDRSLVQMIRPPANHNGLRENYRPDGYPKAGLDVDERELLGFEQMERAFSGASLFWYQGPSGASDELFPIRRPEVKPESPAAPVHFDLVGKPAPGFPMAGLRVVDSKRGVTGRLEPREISEEHLHRVPACYRPMMELRLRAALSWAGRAALPMEGASWGEACVGAFWEKELLTPFIVPPRSRYSGVVRFNPPEFGLRSLRIYPKSGENTRRRRRFYVQPLEAEPAGVRLQIRDAKVLCDWVPVQSWLLELEVDFEPRSMLLHPSCGMESECAHEEEQPRAAYLPQSHRRGAAPVMWTGHGGRLFSLPMDRVLALQYGEKPAGICSAEVLIPPVRRPVAGLSALAEGSPLDADPLPVWREHVRNAALAWARVPSAVRWGGISVIAALLALAVLPEQKGYGQAGQQSVESTSLSSHWANVQSQILSRAAIALTDDFRNGLSDWEGKDDWARFWSYDDSGFVRTGPPALFTPTLSMTDYRMELLGQIDKRSMGWLVRARDLDNHYAMKLTIVQPGPIPEVHLQRYAVLGGKAGPVHSKRLPVQVRNDTVYKVLVEVKDENFIVSVQDVVVDSWSEPNLTSGGVGLFTGKGEMSRVRWIGVWHQYDTLGRLCAFLAPPGLPGKEREE